MNKSAFLCPSFRQKKSALRIGAETLDSDSRKWFCQIAYIKTGFRDGDVSGAFFFCGLLLFLRPAGLSSKEFRVERLDARGDEFSKCGRDPVIESEH